MSRCLGSQILLRHTGTTVPNSDIGAQEKPSSFSGPKLHSHLPDLPSPSPDLYCLLDTPSTSSESADESGTNRTHSPSPKPTGIFHLLDMPSPSSESAHESDAHKTRSPSIKSTNLCHLLDTPSPSSESAHESGSPGARSPSPKLIDLCHLLDTPSSSSESGHKSGTHGTCRDSLLYEQWATTRDLSWVRLMKTRRCVRVMKSRLRRTKARMWEGSSVVGVDKRIV